MSRIHVGNAADAAPFDPSVCVGEICRHTDSWDPETFAPVGPICGKPATLVILWRDRRFSPGCARHGVDSLADDGRAHVLGECAIPVRT